MEPPQYPNHVATAQGSHMGARTTSPLLPRWCLVLTEPLSRGGVPAVRAPLAAPLAAALVLLLPLLLLLPVPPTEVA